VLMDAFVIRATLVPAFMRLAGEANWWAPKPMRRFYERFGFSEVEPEAAVVAEASETSEAPREPVEVG
jgi:RND superfamily putative drug exporter